MKPAVRGGSMPESFSPFEGGEERGGEWWHSGGEIRECEDITLTLVLSPQGRGLLVLLHFDGHPKKS